MRVRTGLVLSLVVCCQAAWAWSGEHHKVMGQMVWRLLADDQALRTRLDALAARLPATQQVQSYNFIEAGAWMDDSRQKGVDDHWHYIDLAYDGRTATFEASWRAMEGQEHGPWAFERALAVVRSADATGSDRVAALARVLHLVGDLHQPLHSVERVGDDGGNTIDVTNYTRPDAKTGQPVAQRLHAYWDWAADLYLRGPSIVLGDGQPPPSRGERAAQWLQDNPVPEELARVLSAQEWCRSSYDLAIALVYDPVVVPLDAKAVSLPPSYVERARPAARARLALAAVRLARQLRDLRPVIMAIQ